MKKRRKKRKMMCCECRKKVNPYTRIYVGKGNYKCLECYQIHLDAQEKKEHKR